MRRLWHSGEARKDDPVQYARLAEKRHWVPVRLGEPAQALRWLTRGIAALEGLDGKEPSVERAG